MYYYLVFFSNRRTAKVVKAIDAGSARRKALQSQKANYGIITSARRATRAETILINDGKWVRTKTVSSAKRRGLGPKPKSYVS